MRFARTTVVGFVLTLTVLLGGMLTEANAQESRLVVGKGTGTLEVGREKFQVTSVVVKLMDDKSVEVTLVSDITVFLSGTWAQPAQAADPVDLRITGGASAGGMQGSGKLSVSSDGKSVTRLLITGSSRTSKRNVKLTFEGK